MQLRRKRFDRPDEVRIVEKARVELIELGELAVGRAIFEPGWRWSDDVKPIVGTESCHVHDLVYVLSGPIMTLWGLRRWREQRALRGTERSDE